MTTQSETEIWTHTYKGLRCRVVGESKQPGKAAKMTIAVEGQKPRTLNASTWEAKAAPIPADAVITDEQAAEAEKAEAEAPEPPAMGKFEDTGTYMSRLNSQLRAVVMFDTYYSSRPEYNLARTARKDGIAIGVGLALEMGLKAGDKVRVRLEKV